jgi:Na+-driven multidrug efflux pump
VTRRRGVRCRARPNQRGPIGVRILMFALLPSWRLANAAATIVGQSLGARKPERAEWAAWVAARYNMYFLGAVGLLFVIFATPIVRLFTTEPEVAAGRWKTCAV